MTAVRRNQGLPLKQTQPVPASSKMDSLLDKAELSRDVGSTSVEPYSRKSKKTLHDINCEKGVRKCKRNSPADTKIRQEGGRGGVPDTRAELPLQPMEKTMESSLPLCSPTAHAWSITVEQISTLQLVEDTMSEQVDMP